MGASVGRRLFARPQHLRRIGRAAIGVDDLAPRHAEARERGARPRGLVAAGEIDESAIAGLVQRAEHASWLNPALRPGIQYIHAIAVKPEQRGKQIGGLLFDRALELGREQGYRALELDVLSDNPAVQFYLRKGMELLVESRAPKPEEFGVPPEWRMGMKL